MKSRYEKMKEIADDRANVAVFEERQRLRKDFGLQVQVGTVRNAYYGLQGPIMFDAPKMLDLNVGAELAKTNTRIDRLLEHLGLEETQTKAVPAQTILVKKSKKSNK